MTSADTSDTPPAGAASAPVDPWALLAALGEVVRVRREGKPGDPELARAFTECLAVWQAELARTGAVDLSVHPHGFVFDDGQVLPPEGMKPLYEAFAARDLRALRVDADIDAEAFAGLVEVLSCDPSLLEAEGGVVAALSARVPFGMSARSTAAPAEPESEAGQDFAFDPSAGEDDPVEIDLDAVGDDEKPEDEDGFAFAEPVGEAEAATAVEGALDFEHASPSGESAAGESVVGESPDPESDEAAFALGSEAEPEIEPEPEPDDGPIVEPSGSLDDATLSDADADALALELDAEDASAELDDLDLELDGEAGAGDLGEDFSSADEGGESVAAGESTESADPILEDASDPLAGFSPDGEAPGDAGAAALAGDGDPDPLDDGLHEHDAVSLEEAPDGALLEDDGEDPFERGATPDAAAGHAEDGPEADAARPAPPPIPEGDEEIFGVLAELEAADEAGTYGDLARRASLLAERAAQQGRNEEAYQAILVLGRHAGTEDRPEPQRRLARECLTGLSQDQRNLLIDRARTPGEGAGVPAAQVLLQLGDLIVPDLLEAATRERDPGRLAQLHGLLITMAERCLPDLLRATEGGDPATVRTAVRLVGETQNPDAVSKLQELLAGGDASVRQEAAKALARIGSKEAIATVVALLDSDVPGMSEVAIHSLAASGSAAPVEPLLAALRTAVDGNDFERARDLIRGLGRLGRPEATPDLAALLLRKSLLGRRRLRELKLAVAAALAGIPGDDAVGALAQAAQSRDAQLRRAAQTALDRRAHALARRGNG